VSAGSLNAVGMSMFPVGKEVEMSEFMVNTFSNLKTSDVYENWWEGPVVAVGTRSSILNDQPLLDTVTKIVK
jgi:hypothetical protein